jgi:uncharacterized protein YjeT (DUF2065 family)
MWLLLLSGIVGLLLGLFLLFLPLLTNLISRFTEQPNEETSALLSRVLVGLAQIVIGFILFYTGVIYPNTWALQYIGLLIMIFGTVFLFLPGLINKINEWGNMVITSETESGIWQRIIYGLLLLAIGIYIVYFSRLK